MSIRHAANRFRRTWVDVWNGTSWVNSATCGAFMASDRFISDREFGNKLRNFLTDPAQPMPAQAYLARLAGTDIYLVGRSSSDIQNEKYSTLVTLRRAYYTCTIYKFESTVAASGVKTNPVRTVVATSPCDHENITFIGSKEYPTVKFGDEVVILPANIDVSTSYEILIDNKYYEVEEVYDFSGLKYCRCLVKPAPTN